MNKFIGFVSSILGSQWFHSLYHAILIGVVSFTTANTYAPNKNWYVGLAGAVLGAIVGWLNSQAAVKAPSQQVSSGSKVIAILLFLGVASSANAGYLMSHDKMDSYSLSLPAGSAIYLMPIEGFDVGAGLPKPSYGLSLNEDIVWGSTSALNGDTNFAPYLGIGGSLYLDGAGVINGNGPLELLGGVNILGPDLDLFGLGNGQGLVPNVLCTYNFDTGEKKVTGGLTVFTDLGPGTAKKLF